MERITVNEIVRAVKGKLVSGSPGDAVSGVSTDSRTVRKGELFVALKGDCFDGHDYAADAVKNGASAVLVRRPVRAGATIIKVNTSTLDALQRLAKYYRNRYKPVVVGITGSNGKTTTKDMLASILSLRESVNATRGNLNNLIGLPLTLFDICSKTRYCVLEMGANHLGEIRAMTLLSSPDIGVVTNIGNAHVGHFHGIKNVLKAKLELIDNLHGKGVAVINNDDYYLRQSVKKIKREVITFGIKKNADVRASDIKYDTVKNKCSFILHINGGSERIELSGFMKNNIYNALAACAVAGCLKYPAGVMARALKSFKFPEMRFNLVEYKGARIINDAYNSNPESVEAALEEVGRGFPDNRKVAVLGDMLELGGKTRVFHEQAGRAVFKNGFDTLVTVGKASENTAGAAVIAGMDKKKVFACMSNNTAVGRLNGILKKNDVVLIKGSRKMKLEEIIKKISVRG